MDFQTVYTTRRSVRTYSERSVPDDILNRVLEAARQAPSAMNNQPWRFVIIRDPVTRQRIAELASYQTFVAEAPILLVCCGRRYHNTHSWIGNQLFVVDVTIAIDHLTLAARNEGLGTCWVGAFDHDRLARLIDVPDDHAIVVLVPLGYPTSDRAFHPTTERVPLSEIVFNERFGGRREA